MGKQKGLFGTLLMLAGTVMMVVTPPLGIAGAVWYGTALVTSYVGSVLAKQAIEDRLAEEQMGIQSTTSGTQAALPILYGTDVKTGSVIADIFAAGEKGAYLYSVNVLSVTPDNGQGIGGVKRTVLASEDAERLLVDFPTNGSYSSGGTAPSTGSYTSNYWYNYHLGDDGDNAVDPMMNSVSDAAWPTTSKGYGLAYTVNKFKYDFADDPEAALFSNIPDLRFYVDGIKVKDFREDPVTYAASNNPILNLYDYLTSSRYGLGIDEAEIDIPSFTAAANYCDTGSDNWDLVIAAGVGLAASASASLATVNMLQYPIGGQLVRAQVGDTLRITTGSNAGDYTIAGTTVSGVSLLVSISPSTFSATDTNMSWELVSKSSTPPFQSSGALMTDSGHRRNIESLLVACRASLFWENGKFHVWIRQPETAETFELNADTNINDIEIIRPGSEDTPNVVEISFLNPSKNWTVDTLMYPDPEEVGTNPYLAEDNDIESRLKIELPMTSHPQVAFSIAEVMLKEARANTTVRVTATQAALQLSIGDVVKLTDDSAGWNAKEFWVMSIGITDENLVELVLQEYSLSAYTTTGTYTPGIVPGTDTPSPLYVPAPTSVNAVSDQSTFVTQADGTVLQYIHVTWTQSAAYNLEYEEIFYKKTSDTYYTLWNRTYQDQVSKLEIIGPVETGVEYTVAVQAVNSLGVRSVKATDTVTPEEKGQAPSDVTGLTSTPTCNRSIILDWDDSTDTDVRAYEVRYGGTDWATSTYYATVAASILTVPTEDVPARSSTWRVKAIDTTGNYSTNAATTNPTFASVAAADPLDLSFQSRNGYIMVTIPTSGANPLNATHFNLYASLTSGFTPSDSTLVDMTTLYRCDQTTTMCAFAIPSGWDGQTIYMKLGTSDWLTDVLSESEQMSTQFTQTGADPATGSGIIPPAVTETWSFSLGVITLTLAVDDPQSRLSGTRFRWKDGLTAAWSSWTEDLTDPYDLSYDVNLVGTSAVIYIEWQIDYDNDTDTSTIGNIVAVDGDRIPRAAFTPQVDDSGNVSLAWNAIDDDLTGIKALANKSSVTPDYPSDGSVQATGEDTQSPTSTLVTLTKGEDAYIKAFPYNNNDSLYGAVYTAKITYQTDVDTIIPTVQATVSAANAITLTLNDPEGYVNGVGFRTYERNVTTNVMEWGSWVDDTSAPFTLTKTVTLDEKRSAIIAWRVRYDIGDGNKYIENSVTFDADAEPELLNVNLSVDDSGNVYLAYTGDDDVGSVKWYDGTSYPSWATVTGSGTVTDGANGNNILVQSGLTAGSTRYIGVVPYTGASGGGTASAKIWYARVTMNTGADLFPVVEEDVDENTSTGIGTVTLTVTSPQGDNLTVDFYEKTGPGSFPGTADQSTSVSSGGTETYDVTLDPDKNVYVKYTVTNTVGTVGGLVVFDPDKIPNITGTLNVTENGEVEFTWQGDSDTASLRYYYVIWYPDDPQGYSYITDPTTGGNYENGRTGSELVYEDGTTTPVVLDQGTRIYMKIRPFNDVNGTGDYGEMYLVGATRPVDTAGNANIINNGNFENFYAYWMSPLYSPNRFLLESTSPLSGSYSGKLMANASAVTKVESSASVAGGEGINVPHIAVEADDKIRVSALCKKDSGAPTLYCYVDWYSNTTTYLSSSAVASWTETAATSKTGTVTAPSSATLCLIRFQIGTGSGYAYIDDVVANFQTNFEVQPLSVMYDVQSSYSPSGGQVLTWSSGNSRWEPADSAGATTLDSLTNVTDSSSASGWYMRSNGALSWTTQSGIPFTDITGTVDADTLDSLDSTAFGRLSSSNTWGQPNDFSQGIIVDSAASTPTVRLDVGTNAFQRAPAGLHWTRAGSTNLWRHAIETDSDLSFERWTGSAWSNVIRLGSDGVVNFASEPTVAGSPIGDGGNAATLDNLDSTQFLRSDTSDSFTGDTLTVESATPVLDFKFSTAPGGYVEIGPAWTDSGGQKQFRYLFDDTDLEFQRWNGSWATMLRFDVAYNRLEFVQRPTEDGYGAGTLGVPTGEVIFSGDDLDALADVNYTTTPTEGQALIWDNANQYWEPGSVAVGSHTLGSHSNVTDASTGAGWYLRTTGATTWAAQSGVPFSDITGTVDADTIDSIDSTNLAVITAQRTITANPWTFQNNNDTGYIDFKYGGSTTADKVVWARILDGTVEMWGWRYDVSGNVDDVYLVRGGATEVMRFDYSASLIEFASRPTVGGTTVALTTDAGAVANLDDIGDVSTDNASGDLLYNSSGTWIGRTPSELNLLTTTSIAAREEGTFKGWLDGPAIDFKAGSGASVTVADTSGVITVTYSVTGGTATNLVSSGSAYVQIDSDNSDTSSVFEVRSDSATPGAGTPLFQIEQPVSSNATIETYGTILKLGSLNTGVTGNDIQILGGNGSPYSAEFYATGGQDIRLRVNGTSDNFWLSDGTSENRIAPIYGWATGTGSPGSVAAVKGALYFRYS